MASNNAAQHQKAS